MTIGIYSLYYDELDEVYVGQSVNIEKRYEDHISALKRNKHTNYKLQEVFLKYGYPKLSILEESSIDNLDKLEVLWTTEFNSLHKGLNIIEPGKSGGEGFNGSNSKYSKLDILKCFRYSYLEKYIKFSAREIAYKFKVDKGLLYVIRQQRGHLWLKECYPYQYAKMLKLNVLRINKGSAQGKEYHLVSPESKIFIISNLAKFALDNGLDRSSLRKVLCGTRSNHKGWTKYSSGE